MPSLETLSNNPDSRFMGLFVGRSGSGKTCQEISFPRPIRYFDFDGRIRGGLAAKWLGDFKDIDYDYYPPKGIQMGSQKIPTFTKLNNDLEALQVMCATGQNRYKTVVLASLTASCFALIQEAIPLTHGKDSQGKGKFIGNVPMVGPEDYGYEAINTYNILAFLRSLPIQNIIVSAHIVDRYGKAPGSDQYSESVKIGSKLSLRDKISENTLIYFDHIFEFEKEEYGNAQYRHMVTTKSDLARTSFTGLDTKMDITGKSLYAEIMKKVKPEELVVAK